MIDYYILGCVVTATVFTIMVWRKVLTKLWAFSPKELHRSIGFNVVVTTIVFFVVCAIAPIAFMALLRVPNDEMATRIYEDILSE